MARTAKVEVAGGSVVVVKAAEGADARQLRDEGARLRAAEHPGVVAVVGSDGDDHRWELRLAHGGRPATLLHPASPAQVAAIASSVADTLADLHERGVVHGRLAARHILVGPDGLVRLCGFGPAPHEAGPEADVAAVGAIITELLGAREELEPLPEVRWRRRAAWPGVTRRALLSLADSATAEPAGRRPTARRLAATIREAVPPEGARRRPRSAGSGVLAPAAVAAPSHDLTPPGPAAGADRSGEGRETTVKVGVGRGPRPLRLGRSTRVTDSRAALPTRLRWRAAIAATVGASLLVVGAWRSLSPDDVDQPEAAPQHPAPCAVVEQPAGPCLPVRVEGTSVRVGDIGFAVGQPGDQVVVGDWDCDGEATVALRRPSTGEIFLFPTWAAETALEVLPAVVVPGAADLRPPDGRCGPPLVVRHDGSIEPVPVQGAA